MQWGTYAIVRIPFPGMDDELARAEARANFEALMAQKAQRIQMLSDLLALNGIALTKDEAGVQELNDFFCDNVSEDPDRPRAVLPEWLSVCFDVALFLGDLLIERHPQLRWDLHVWGKSNINYQHPVIVGFTNVGGAKNYSQSFDFRRYASKIANEFNAPEIVTIQGQPVTLAKTPVERDRFVRSLRSADELA